jgi:glycosyltransferase involved in cell wall biosynthesis
VRVAHVSLDGNLPRYGIGTAVVRLTEALARRGHDVLLAVRRQNVLACPAIPGVRLVPLAHVGGLLGGRPAYLRQIRRATRAGVDVLHVHALSRVAAWLLPARHRAGARLVVTAHSADEFAPSGPGAGSRTARRAARRAAQVARVLAGADEVVAPSRFVADRLERVAARPVRVVPWGPTDAMPAERAPHAGFRVVYLGRLVREKGVHVLLDAFHRAFPDGEDARLVVAGEGPERAALRSRADELGLGSRVEFVGHLEVHERRAILARADVVAAPTLGDYETFCLAALDGSAAGAALLVADGGALPERAEACGLVVPGGDVLRWAATLRGLREDPARVEALGAAGRNRAASFGWDAVARQYEAAYAGEDFRH